MSSDTFSPTNGKRLSPLFWLLLSGVVVRLLLWGWFYGRTPEIFDEKYLYSAIAENLVQRGEFADEPGRITSKRPPLYPAFVAGIYFLFGVDNYDAVRLIQSVLSLGTVAIVYQLGRRIYNPRVGWWAASFCCFYPSLLVYNNLLLAEVLFIFLLCGGVYLMVLYFQQNRWIWLVSAGATLALAAMTRSVLWLYPPVTIVVLMLQREKSWRNRFAASTIFTLTFAVVLAPWAVRNTILQKTLVVVDAPGGRNFMMGNYRDTPLYRPWDAIALSGEHAWYSQLDAPRDDAGDLTQGQIDKLALRSGLRFVVEHPILTAKRDVLKFFHFWQLERELIAGAYLHYFGSIPTWGILLCAALILGAYVCTLLGGVIGIVLTPPPDRTIHLLLLSFILFVTGMHVLAFGHSRYHLPLMPLIFIYGAAAVTQLRGIWSRRFRPAFCLAVVLSGIFMSSWTWEIAVQERDLLAHIKH
jgi:4-amino-4-deoxy-L-arabinose transferase-like glycosyltransferase